MIKENQSIIMDLNVEVDRIPMQEINDAKEILNCPICYNDLNLNDSYCIIEKCQHSICFDCFDTLKKHNNKCPICGLEFSSVLNRKIKENENEIIKVEVEEIIFLCEKDYEEIKQNKNNLLGK